VSSSGIPLLLLGGPTAAGKSAIAVAAARRLGGEIVCADSRQVYRRLDAGTAKPTAEERALVPHHLVDIVEPEEPFSVSEWLARAAATIAEIHARGKLPMVVGGTGLYLRRLTHGLFESPPADEALRASLAEEERTGGRGTLHRRLVGLDPVAASRMHPHLTRRIIRALEVIATTGQPISKLQAEQTKPSGDYRGKLAVVTRSREKLRRRANLRIDAMLANGWEAEIRALLASGVRGDAPGMNAVGYAPLVQAVRGEIPMEEALRLIRRDTSRYIKRQLTWFRREEGAEWIDAETNGEAGAIEAIVQIGTALLVRENAAA